MKYINATLSTPAANLACDEALLDACEDGASGEVLRFWAAPERFVVVGYANQVAREARVAACAAEGVPILRRCSGGGTVLQGPGCLSYSLILRVPESGPLQSISGTNSYIMGRLRTALAKLAKGEVHIQGHTDLALDGLKFSGNAQRRRRKSLIFHGTFLLRFDISSVEKFLQMPSKQPDYRQNRQHQEFLTNLHLNPHDVKQAIQQEWQAIEPLTDLPVERIEELCRAKYLTPEWNSKL